MIETYDQLRDLVVSLALPRVDETTSWGKPCLKAHGSLWVWWSPHVDAAVFKSDFHERDMLLAADPSTFVMHPHYAKHPLLLVRAGRIDPDWARRRLIRQWRAAAPKRWLAAWDSDQEAPDGSR